MAKKVENEEIKEEIKEKVKRERKKKVNENEVKEVEEVKEEKVEVSDDTNKEETIPPPNAKTTRTRHIGRSHQTIL